MTDTPTPAPADLTPEVLALVTEARQWPRDMGEGGLINELADALLSGVRSRDARIAELEAEVAARDAVIAQALEMLMKHGTRGGWQAAGAEAKRILQAGAH